MITEIAQIEIKPGMEAEFEAGVKKAAPVFKRAKGCRAMELRRSVEKPARYRLFVAWETVENHTVDFRGSRRFPGMAQAWSRIVSRRRPKWSTWRRSCGGFEQSRAAGPRGTRPVAFGLASLGPGMTAYASSPHWRSGPARRIRDGRLRRASRSRRGLRRATHWRSTAGCGSCRKTYRSTIPGPD